MKRTDLQEPVIKQDRPLSIKLIANPTAGKTGGKKITQIVECLRKEGAHVEICTTQKRGDALEAAKKARASKYVNMVIAAGGDGTINEVINGIVGSDIPMGVIPLGTVNLFALETGIPMDVPRACDVIFKGVTKKVRVGKVNDRYFMIMAGVGFDADVVYKLDLGLKRRLGKFAYVLTGFSRLAGYSFGSLDVEFEGRSCHAYSIVVGNMKYYGGKMSITPFADFEKGTLDVCIFKGRGVINMLRYTWGIFRKSHLSYSDVEYITVKSLKVSSPGRMYIQIDGDSFGTLPAEFSIAGERLNVILPNSKV